MNEEKPLDDLKKRQLHQRFTDDFLLGAVVYDPHKIPHVDATIQLTDEETDAYAIMAAVRRALIDIGLPIVIDKYLLEATQGDFDDLMRVTKEWVNVI